MFAPERWGISPHRNDCVVRAIALAAGLPYAKVSGLCAEHGRSNPNGSTRWATTYAVLEAVGAVLVDDRRRKPSETLGTWRRGRTDGRYVIFVSGHALAFVDGVQIDHSDRPRRIIRQVYKLG